MPARNRPLRIAVVGGGPGGLYLASLVKQLDERHEITVWERNAADDTFGFGVVFSDETLGAIEHADAEIYAQMEADFASWADIDVHYRGRVITSGGHGFAAMSRHRLLDILQRRAAALGTRIHYRTEAPLDLDGFDLAVAADGVNSITRARYPFGTSFSTGGCTFMWLGTPRVFEAFKFFIVETEFGVMQAHAYPYSRDMSTFVVEMHEDVWRRAGLDVNADRAWSPGDNDVESIRRCEEIFAEALGGAELVGNNSRWINFVTVRNTAWRHANVVLLGDAAHTAHFTIGSGTKLAMEDAHALAARLHEHPDVDAALEAYEAERRPVVESTQRSAQASMEWFENLAQYVGQEPEQFAFNLLTRSRRITYANLRLRDPDYVDEVDDWFVEREHARGAMSGPSKPVPPMFLPFRLGDLELPNRIIVSPMDMYCARDGLIGDFHLVHLGSKALGGAGLVMTEMVCVSPEARITPGCAGLYTTEHMLAFRRVIDFIHDNSPAKVGVQLGHAGRKGSTKLMWEGMDEPLDDGNWELVAPSPIRYLPVSQVPREMTRGDMDTVRDQFVRSAKMAAAVGFDLVELHCAHGYLLASFISPVSNVRTDAYGGSLDNRLRFPLEVFDAVREVWPAGRPVTVRISATDWVDGGLTEEESVAVARTFFEHGAAAIDVSTGQTTPDEAPAFGRSYQTPFADRIRNRLGVPTIAVGAISSYDDVNSIILAGRADLCALARAHLYDPAWTLHAAAEQDVTVPWPVPFERGNRKPPSGRTDGPRPRLELHRIDPDARRHERWVPKRVAASEGGIT